MMEITYMRCFEKAGSTTRWCRARLAERMSQNSRSADQVETRPVNQRRQKVGGRRDTARSRNAILVEEITSTLLDPGC